MQQLRINVADDTLEAYKQYARQHGLSLDEVVQAVVARGVTPQCQDWLEECFDLMDRSGANSQGQRWKREDLYRA